MRSLNLLLSFNNRRERALYTLSKLGYINYPKLLLISLLRAFFCKDLDIREKRRKIKEKIMTNEERMEESGEGKGRGLA